MALKDYDNKTLITILELWQNIEQSTIQATGVLLNKVEDRVLKAFIGDIRGDSRKHKELLDLVLRIEKNDEAFLDNDAKTVLEEFILIHGKLEEHAVEIAEVAKEKATHPLSRLILDYILQDEKKHDHLIDSLREFCDPVD